MKPTNSYLPGVERPGTAGVGGPNAGEIGPAYSLPDLPHSVTSVSTGAVYVRVLPRNGTSSPVWPGPALGIARACGLLDPTYPLDAQTLPSRDEDSVECEPADISMPTYVDPLLFDP